MSQDVLPPGGSDTYFFSDDPPWADPWKHPEYFHSITLRRMIAYMIDAVIIALIIGMVWWVGMLVNVITFGAFSPLLALLIFFMPIIYHTVLVGGPRAATLGMRTMGIRVMSIHPLTGTHPSAALQGRPSTMQAFAQVVLFYLSVAMTSFLILLICLFNARRRTLHDWLSATVIVNQRPFNVST